MERNGVSSKKEKGTVKTLGSYKKTNKTIQNDAI